jgi:hypothetical protein
MILVAPGLLAHPSACRAQPAFARLAHYAGAPVVDAAGLTMLTCATLGLAHDPPVAALMAAGVGLDCGSDYWLKADPVTLSAGRSSVRLAGRVDDLDADETRELLTALNAHFHGDGVTFVAPRPDTWLARVSVAPDLVTTPLARVQQGELHAELPRGGAGPQWRRWQDEIQMLLHGHPVNSAREARGAAIANAVWFWGGGKLEDAGAAPALDVDAPDGAIGDLLRGIARTAPAGDATPRRRVFGYARADSDAVIELFATRALEPAIAALEHHQAPQLDVVTDGAGAAVAWRVHPPSLVRRLSARLHARPFEIPENIE